MDLQHTPEQLHLREASRRLLSQRLAALVERLPDAPRPDQAQALADARALGWLGLGLPESVGGAGGFRELTLVHEELGRGLAPSLTTTLQLAARLLLHAAPTSPLLAPLCDGEVLLAPALGTEVAVSSGALRGQVPHVVDARAVTHLLVVASDGALHLVPLEAAGLTVVDEPSGCDLTSCTVRLDGVVPQRVVALDARDALRSLRLEAIVLASARALGGGRAVLERSVAHVSTRHQFGRAIGTFQAVQHQLADVATALDATELAVARAAWAVETGEGVAAAAAVAGLAAQEAFAHATRVAHQLHGGMGFVLDSPLHLWSARAVADPTVPLGRRPLLDLLGEATGVTPSGIVAPAHHREPETVSS